MLQEMKGVSKMLALKLSTLYVSHKLIYEDNLVGYRIKVRGTDYDVSLDDFNLIMTDFNPTKATNSGKQIPSVTLVSRGNLLVPEGLSSASELQYRDYAKLHGFKNMDKTDVDLKILYNKYNQEVFDGELPTLVGVEWSSNMHVTAGVCKSRIVNGERVFRIVLSRSYHDINAELIDTLVHEMIHVKYPRHGHDSYFLNEAHRINTKFGMDITVYAHGDVNYKYLYECSECSQKYERMRRIDTTRNVCGRCRGKLLLIFEN